MKILLALILAQQIGFPATATLNGTVRDDGALTASDDVTITALPRNVAPNVDAGPDQTVTPDVTVSLKIGRASCRERV